MRKHLTMAILTENIYTDIIAGIVSILAAVVVYMKWSHGYWSRRNVLTPPIHFLYGNTKELIFQTTTFGVDLKNVYDRFKSTGLKYCGYYFIAKPQLVLLDLDLIKTVMSKDFAHFTDHGGYVNEEIDPLSGHLFSLKGLKWKNLRAKLTPTFTSGKMKMMFQTLVECSDELITLMDETIRKGEDIDIKDVVGRFTTDIIGSCAFGIECNSLKNPESEFRKYGTKVFQTDTIETIRQLVGALAPGVLEFFRLPITEPDVSKFFMNIVKETVNYREQNNVVRKDFMHLLIQLKNNIKITDEANADQLKNVNQVKESETEVGKTLTIGELAAQAFVFFLAGFETSSTTLTFCFYELVSNLDVQEKLRDEINEVLEKNNGKLTYNAIMEMTYMDKCVNETLRKYPPVPALTRECTQTYNVPNSNVVVRKGDMLLIPIMGIQRDDRYYPDPEKFDPERFSPEVKSQRHPYAWLPFGEGPRACIGLRFGVMQTKVALAVLLKNYRFTLNSKTQTPLVMDPKPFVLTASGGIWLNAEKVST